ncbi:MAG: YfcC family protein [Bacilli bacterium]
MEKETKKETVKPKKKFKFVMPSAYTVLLILILLVSLATILIPDVKNASLADIVMSPINGFVDAIDVAIFVIIIGGFLGVVAKTEALSAGIAKVVKKLKGKEMVMIPVLMFIFSLGGTTYGMAEETIAFYVLIVGTMMFAGFDSLTGAAIILLGAGVGVLGSTINPFAIGAAVDALPKGIEVNQTIIIVLGTILWITSYLIATAFVLEYAKRVKKRKEESLLSEIETKNAEKTFLKKGKDTEAPELTGKRKVVLGIFALGFVIMILSLLPWADFGITIFDKSTAWLFGIPFGQWYFLELASWFVLLAIIIGIVYRLKEKEIADSFIDGANDMIGVALVIAVSRGISVIMATTGLGDYILTNAARALKGVNTILFSGLSYVLYLGLSFLIPSTSGLAGASMPIMGGLANALKLSPEVMIMIFCSACGVVNLVTPTSAVVMGGLAVSRIEFSTWIKFVWKVLLALIVTNIAILSIAMMVL